MHLKSFSLGLLLVLSMGLTSCAEETTSIEVGVGFYAGTGDTFIDTAESTLSALNAQGKLSMRLLYTHAETSDTIFFPSSAAPPNITDAQGQVTGRDWRYSVGAGYSVSQQVKLDQIPLGHPDTVMVVEFLQARNDADFTVVGYACIVDPVAGQKLTKTRLKVIKSKSPFAIALGRSCSGVDRCGRAIKLKGLAQLDDPANACK